MCAPALMHRCIDAVCVFKSSQAAQILHGCSSPLGRITATPMQDMREHQAYLEGCQHCSEGPQSESQRRCSRHCTSECTLGLPRRRTAHCEIGGRGAHCLQCPGWMLGASAASALSADPWPGHRRPGLSVAAAACVRACCLHSPVASSLSREPPHIPHVSMWHRLTVDRVWGGEGEKGRHAAMSIMAWGESFCRVGSRL